MNTKYCKVRSFELLGSLKTDDAPPDDVELDETELEAEVSEPLYVNESAQGAQKPIVKNRTK